MDNLLHINNAIHVNKIFDNALDKLIIMLFYVKSNATCKNAKMVAEKIAKIYTNIIFILIDLENFSGESPYCKDISDLPRFDFFYSKTMFGRYTGYVENNIINNIKWCEQQILLRSQSFTPTNTPIAPNPTYHVPIQSTPTIPQMMPIPETQNNMPNAQQIQQMFNIFQMMQQMGILNNQNILPTNSHKDKIEGEIILKNGDKLIPLADGKYGLIKKK